MGAVGPDEAITMGAEHELEVGEDPTLLTSALAGLPDATLSGSEERFRRTMEDAPIAMAMVSPEGRFLAVNPAICRMYGRDADELMGMTWQTITHPDDLEAGREAIGNLLAGRTDTIKVRKRFLHSSGEVLTADLAVSAIRDAAGHPLFQVAQMVDVSDQVRIEQELRTSEAHFRLLAENASDVVLQVTGDGKVAWVSPSVERLLGWAPDQVLGTDANRVIAPADLEAVRDAVAGLGRSGATELRCRVLTASGSERWMAVRMSVIPGDGPVPVSFVVALRDIAEEVEARAERDERAAELQMIVDTSPDAILRLDTDLRVTFVNQVVRFVDDISNDWVGRCFLDIGLPDEVVPLWDAELNAALASGELRTFEVQGREQLGRPWWDVRVAPTRNAGGEVSHLTIILRDITSRKEAERELFIAATHDPLTGLANRAEVLSEIQRALSAADRSRRATAVLMLDLDHFKNVNDSLGHAVGDRLLVAAAQRLVSLVRTGDMAGRLGGDEFVVVMRDLDDPTEAARIGERVVAGFRDPLAVGELALITTASVGLSVATPAVGATDDPVALLREADTALYRAKGGGRDALAFFNDDLRAEVAERMRVEEALRGALEREELELWYQPEVDLGTGAVRAVEALLRWRLASGEVLPAERFIEIAEDTGLIVDIGDWVIHRASAEAARWAALDPTSPLTVRINLSSVQLSEVGLVDELRDAIAASGVDPGSLCLEITEAALLHDLPTAQEKVAAIRSMGVGVAVDAFGTGDSSIRCLEQCEVDVLKIDPSLGAGVSDQRLVAGVLALAAALGLSVTAKGVETSEQAEVLRVLGCGSGQGWLWSRAIEAREIDELLGRHPGA